jgi:hypothetical protein
MDEAAIVAVCKALLSRVKPPKPALSLSYTMPFLPTCEVASISVPCEVIFEAILRNFSLAKIGDSIKESNGQLKATASVPGDRGMFVFKPVNSLPTKLQSVLLFSLLATASFAQNAPPQNSAPQN